ncbi:esterase-like activity of phytase family protein [Methylotuvimicrobium sp. KM1]|uniref:esterase-like activity of phytase family protein n=1 Tax=Methylotuvimicrobium sp. KM1 TaxID=3377707 RepID=UPI00384B0413
MKKMIQSLIGAGLLVQVASASALEIKASFEPAIDDPALDLGVYTHPAGGNTLSLFGGAGSGSYRGPGDAPNIIWTVGDRGPNFTCGAAPSVLGLTAEVACPADPERGVAAGVGRIYPRPDYAPSIYQLRMEKSGLLKVLKVIPLLNIDGTPISGLLNPQITGTTEIPRDGAGNVLDQDASAIDAEGVVRLPHFGGRFFIGEENATGLVEVASDGRILKRFVPAGTENEYTHPVEGLPAGYPIEGSLPELLAKRRINRGIESMAVSPDFRFLYFIVQSPLDNPNTTVRDTPNIRLYKARLKAHPKGSKIEVVGEWVYQLDPVSILQNVGVTDANRVRDLRISEMMWLDKERLLVIERTDQATALYEIDLKGATNIAGSEWDDPLTIPTLEQYPDLSSIGIKPVRKKLRFIASSLDGAEPQFAEKLEGLGLTNQKELILINDDDFGITGQQIRVDIVKGSGFGR